MKRTRATALAFVAILGAAALARAQAPPDGPGIRDRAGMFSPEAVKKAEQGLREVEASGHWQTLIETRDTFDGRPPKEVAIENAKNAKLRGLSIAIGKKEHKLEIEPSVSSQRVFTKGEMELVKDAFGRSFRKGDYDEGLLDAVGEIRRAAMKVGVRDHAKLFSPEAVKQANEALEAARRKTSWGAVIESVETLGEKPLRDAAADHARAAQVHGLYVLIAKKEHKIYAQPSESGEKLFPREKARALEESMSAAFKEKAFDKGLHDAVESIRSAMAVTAASAPAAKPERPLLAQKGGPADGAFPRPPAPAEPPPPAVPKPPSLSTPMILLGGGVLLLILGLIFRGFRRSQPESQPFPSMSPQGTAGGGGGFTPQPAPRPGYPPASRPGAAPGYGPQQPGPAPGYGYGPPAPGYGGGYGAPMPPQQGGGGGFMSGALGGAAGAIAGNILYDKFGRPHEVQGAVPPQGGGYPHQGGPPLDPNAGAGAGSPPETYDPNAGVGADWGTPDQPGPAPDAEQPGVGGDWGGAEPVPEPDTGGDWSGGSEEPAETGGDWGGGEEEPADPGGDWGGGGDDQGGGDDDQGGGDPDQQGGSW